MWFWSWAQNMEIFCIKPPSYIPSCTHTHFREFHQYLAHAQLLHVCGGLTHPLSTEIYFLKCLLLLNYEELGLVTLYESWSSQNPQVKKKIMQFGAMCWVACKKRTQVNLGARWMCLKTGDDMPCWCVYDYLRWHEKRILGTAMLKRCNWSYEIFKLKHTLQTYILGTVMLKRCIRFNEIFKLILSLKTYIDHSYAIDRGNFFCLPLCFFCPLPPCRGGQLFPLLF